MSPIYLLDVDHNVHVFIQYLPSGGEKSGTTESLLRIRRGRIIRIFNHISLAIGLNKQLLSSRVKSFPSIDAVLSAL
jgi:hypothetical protein